MSVFKVDSTPNNSLVRENGAFVRTSGADEIRQDNQVSVQILRGEYPFNELLGFDWLASLGRTPPEILASRLTGHFNARPGVVEVLELEVVDEGDRRVSVPYKARISEDNLRQALLVQDVVSVQGL